MIFTLQIVACNSRVFLRLSCAEQTLQMNLVSVSGERVKSDGLPDPA